MNFAFSEEQEELRKSVRRFMEEKSSVKTVRSLMESSTGYDLDTWKQLSEQLGLCSLAIPEKFGGAGYGALETTVVFEEMGRALFCGPYFSTVAVAANVILSSGDESACEEYLPSIAAGETLATLASVEASGSWDLEAIDSIATNEGGTWKISGEKRFVLDGHIANLILVTAKTANGVSLFAVDANDTGVTTSLVETLDQTRKMATVTLTGAIGRLIGDEGEATNGIETGLDLACVALAAEQVGGAAKCLEMAVDYAKVRIQFGRPIGSFQAIKHKCADLLLEVESAKSAAYYSAWAASEMNEEFQVAAPLAKSFCSDAYFKAAAENIQIHGGIGFTWEHDAHLYFKRAKASQLLFGDATFHRERLASRIGL